MGGRDDRGMFYHDGARQACNSRTATVSSLLALVSRECMHSLHVQVYTVHYRGKSKKETHRTHNHNSTYIQETSGLS